VLLLPKAAAERRAPLHLRWLQRAYEARLRPTLQSPAPVLTVGAALVLVSLIGLPLLKPSLTPTFREPNVLVHLNAAPGTSAPEMSRIAARVSDELRHIPGVTNVGAHVGRAVLSDQASYVNSSEVWVTIDPSAPYDTTRSAIQEVVSEYPGISESVHSYLQEKADAVSPAADNAVVVRVYGDNLDKLRTAADDVRHAVSGVKGVASAQVLLPAEQPTLSVQVDLGAAQRYGLKPGDVRRQAATLVSGTQVGSLFDAQKVFEVVVWGTPEVRSGLEGVRNLLLDTPGGDQVRLSEVARAVVAPAPAIIRHDSARSYLDVRADVVGRPLDAVANDVEQRVHGVKFPLEYHAEVLGNYAQRQAAEMRLFALAAAVLIGIYLLLQAAFGSWRLGALALLTLIASLSGGVLTGLAGGSGLSLGAVIGLLAVFGLAVRTTIAQIQRYQQVEPAESRAFQLGAITQRTGEHVAPLIATALATALVFVPYALAGELPGFEILRSMAGVVLGGLVSSMFVSLFVVPALFVRFATSTEPALSGESYSHTLLPLAVAEPAFTAGASAD
jgi:Cu/Ag efflux pump CusA